MPRAEIEKLLADAIGLEPASVGESALSRSIRSRMESCGVDRLDLYVERLRQSSEELQLLIEEVVVPETWFLRDPETFRVLADWASGREKLKALSAGCCTGEEPYSIAMCLLDAGIPPEGISIRAVDISRRSLKHASNALYGKRSFRTEDLSFRDRYFVPAANAFKVNDVVRSRVLFVEGNVLAGAVGPDSTGFDVIFCRNVIIYFDQQSQEGAIQRLKQMLQPNGILFAGPAESFLILQKGFATSGKARGFVHERRQREAPHLPDRRAIPVPVRPPPPPLPAAFPPRPAPPPPARNIPDLNDAARLANSGHLAEAAEICRSYLMETGPSAQAYYLLGLVSDAMDRRAEAADHYRKAVYLEPDYIDALSQLVPLMESMGDKAGANRLRERIERAQARERK